MWVLKSFSKNVVAGPFKSQAEMARKLGVSQQYVNRQIQKCNFLFHLDGQKVIAYREKEFVGGGKRGSDKEELAMRLGVSKEAVEKVFRKNRSGFVQTPQGKVKIQKLKPGEKPPLPAVRVLWDDDTEKQDFVSFAAAAKELKIHPKTIPSAIKAGRDSFTRKSDGKKFTFEIPEENTPSRKKPKPLSDEDKTKRAEAAKQAAIKTEVMKFYNERVSWNSRISYKDQEKHLEKFWPGAMEGIRKKVSFVFQPPVAPPAPPPVAPPPAAPAQGGRPVPVFGHLHEIFREKREEKQLQRNDARRYQKPGLSKLEKEVEELQFQEELYYALRVKYAGWFLDDTVGSGEETQTVLYNPQTGEDFLVEEEEYELLAQFFLSRGYVDFLSENEFYQSWCHGKLQFSARKSSVPQEETWMLLNFMKDP